MGYYAQSGVRIDTNTGIAKYTSAAINGRFKGMNVLTTLDTLPKTGGFEGYTAYDVTGYKWGGTQINYVQLSSLKRNINNCLRTAYLSAPAPTRTIENALAYPKVYYVMFQAAGGAGGSDSSGTGTGGGSGYYTLSKVVLQPGSSFKVTHTATKATIQLVTGTAYMHGRYRAVGYSFSIAATKGNPGGRDVSGVGFRRGGEEEKPGGGIEANELSCDGYACPAYAIDGGLPGQDRVSYGSDIEKGRGGGGGGASAGPHLRGAREIMRTGGDGAFYYKDTYHTYSHPAKPGEEGAGGGGGEGPLGGAAGGPSKSYVFS